MMKAGWIITAVALMGCISFGGGCKRSSKDAVSYPPRPWETNSYYPPWKDIAPAEVIPFSHDGGLSDEQNGAALADAILALEPGQKLEIGAGTYSINRWFNVVLKGTASAPIWIVAASGATPVLTRPNNSQNVMNVGSGSGNHTEYVCFRGLEITGGDDLIKLYSCSNVWIDQCYLHDGDGVGIAANSADTSYLYITRNEIYRPGGDPGEGMYLGANNSAHRMTNSIVALNHVHQTVGSSQGDGIEVKQGSFNNWVVENLVHDTNYPCIIAYGTDGKGVNVIERNILYNCNDNTMQVQGEAIIRNNLIMAGGTAFASHDHQGNTCNLTFVHNTVINTGRGANLSDWNNRPGMVFANNVIYSRDAESIRFPNGSVGVAVAGNVVLGSVSGAGAGYVTGTGLADFVNVSWDANSRDATPSPGSAIIGTGDPGHAVGTDITGSQRVTALDSGAFDHAQ